MHYNKYNIYPASYRTRFGSFTMSSAFFLAFDFAQATAKGL